MSGPPHRCKQSSLRIKPLDPSLFQGIPSGVGVHNGFAREQASTVSAILSVVQNTLSTKGLSSVTVVGHSLGAALALLDGVFFSLQLPNNGTVEVTSYGMPSAGNQAFADFVDSQLSGCVTHMNNQEDPVPVVLGEFLGFHHPSGRPIYWILARGILAALPRSGQSFRLGHHR